MHIAQNIESRTRYHYHVVPVTGALDDLVIACDACDAFAGSAGGDSLDRWLVCQKCHDYLSIREGFAGLNHIAPMGDEPFSPWYARCAHVIPEVPKNVAEQWIHRHWGNSPFQGLDLLSMQFKREVWQLSDILEINVSSHWRSGRINAAEETILEDSFLGKYMTRHRTWPEPVIVSPSTEELPPYLVQDTNAPTLLEGHVRLTYLHVLNYRGIAGPRHDVWNVSISS